MGGGDELSVLAEVAVALAGFSGIVVAIQSSDRVHPWDTYRAAVLLSTGFTMLLLALLPSALYSFGVAGPSLWRLSSALSIPIVLAPVFIGYRYTPEDFTSSPYFQEIRLGMVVLVVVAVAANSINALALGTPGVFSLFYIAILSHIPSTALQFLVVILIRPPN